MGQYAAAIADAPPWLQPLERQLHVDFRFHLPNDMLVKVDRMSMAHALEVRVPLLDLEVLRACLALPPQWKRRGRRGKIVLRRMLAADLPPEVVERRKAGFLVPLEAWMQSAWQPLLRQHLTEQFAADSGLLCWPVLQEMIECQAARREDYAYPLFALLVLALWWRIWITGEMPVASLRPQAVPTGSSPFGGVGGRSMKRLSGETGTLAGHRPAAGAGCAGGHGTAATARRAGYTELP